MNGNKRKGEGCSSPSLPVSVFFSFWLKSLFSLILFLFLPFVSLFCHSFKTLIALNILNKYHAGGNGRRHLLGK
jgi:hypothetical protein